MWALTGEFSFLCLHDLKLEKHSGAFILQLHMIDHVKISQHVENSTIHHVNHQGSHVFLSALEAYYMHSINSGEPTVLGPGSNWLQFDHDVHLGTARGVSVSLIQPWYIHQTHSWFEPNWCKQQLNSETNFSRFSHKSILILQYEKQESCQERVNDVAVCLPL